KPLPNSIEIDLFNSSFWQRKLLGTWKIKPEKSGELSFYWEAGKLLKIVQDKNSPIKNIIFKNPPLHDASFTTFLAELQSLRRLEWADQTTKVANDITFSQSNGYEWEQFKDMVSFTPLNIQD